jgi:hypothetical protein
LFAIRESVGKEETKTLYTRHVLGDIISGTIGAAIPIPSPPPIYPILSSSRDPIPVVCFSTLGETKQSLVLKNKSTTFVLRTAAGDGEEMGDPGNSISTTLFSQIVGLATMMEEETTIVFFSTVFSAFYSTICSWRTCSSRLYL